MTLPVFVLPHSSVVVEGEKIDIRSLSRAEAIQLAKFQGNPDEAEDHVLACGAGVTLEEAADWRAKSPVDVVGAVVDAILELSGLTEAAQKSE